MKNKAILRKGEPNDCVVKSISGKHELIVKHGVYYDYIYSDEGDTFYLISDDMIFEETSTAFDFVDVDQPVFYTTLNVGRAKYVLNSYDGIKKHPDGSKFYDIHLFSNKKLFDKRKSELISQGYKLTAW